MIDSRAMRPPCTVGIVALGLLLFAACATDRGSREAGFGTPEQTPRQWALAVATALQQQISVGSVPQAELETSAVEVELTDVALDGAILSFEMKSQHGSAQVAAAVRAGVEAFHSASGGTLRLPPPSEVLRDYVDRFGLVVRFDGARLSRAPQQVELPCAVRAETRWKEPKTKKCKRGMAGSEDR